MQYFALEVLREGLACQDCHEHVAVAPKPDEVVDRGVLGNELMVQALVDHYDDGVPWERMERNAAQQEVPLKANTLAASVGKVIDLFDPVVAHIKEATLSSGFTALDATRMPVLDPEHPLGIQSGSLWLVEGDHRYACFVYAPTGHADHLAELLRGRKLASVMCDGSPTNNCVERAGGRRGGCNAHARRGSLQRSVAVTFARWTGSSSSGASSTSTRSRSAWTRAWSSASRAGSATPSRS